MRTGDDRKSARRVMLALIAITVIAFGLRWPAVHRLLPQLPEPDAFLVMHAQALRGDAEVLTKQRFDERYPMLVTRILQFLPQPSVDSSLSGARLEQAALDAAATPYVQGRVVILLFSMLLVPLTFFVARGFTGAGTALFAAFLVATSLLHALFSTQARPHGAHASLALLAVLCALKSIERPSFARIAVAAITSSLAIACLPSGLFTLPPLAVALFFTSGPAWKRVAKAVLVPIVALFGAFWAYPVLPWIDANGVHMGGAGSHDVLFSQFTLGGIAVASTWLGGHDPVLFTLTIFGTACLLWSATRNARALLRGERPKIVIAAAYVLPYLVVVALSEELYDRFLLPLVPWFAIAAAYGVEYVLALAARDRPMRLSRPLIVALAAPACAFPLVVLVQFARVSSAQDTLGQARAWIRANDAADRGRLLTSPYLALPMVFDEASLASLRDDNAAQDNVWIAWQWAHPVSANAHSVAMFPARLANTKDDLAPIDRWLDEHAPEWAVLLVSRKMSAFPATRRLHEWVEEHGELAWRSQGMAPLILERGVVDYQAVEDMAPRLLGTHAFGPTIEIWRLRR